METAAKDFSAYLQKEPEDLQAVLMLSQVYMATQQDKQALLLLERYQEPLMENPDSALMLGDLFIRQKKSHLKLNDCFEIWKKNILMKENFNYSKLS